MLGKKNKALMRERLVAYMEHKPIRTHTRSAVRSPLPFFTFFRAHHYSGALAVALLATVSTFGVSSAADDALPGDLLYPVKVNINEEIKTVLLSSEEELLWEGERAELRLEEASQLAAEGRLDTELQEEVSKLFAEHTEAVTEKMHAIESTDPALAVEVSSGLEAAFGAHEVVLARLIVEQEDGAGTDGARGLVEQVRTAALEAEKTREDAEQIFNAVDEGVGTDVTEETPDGVTEATSSDDTPKTESANMRERAVYRAQERVMESLARARALVAELDPESDIAKQAMSQIAAGEALMASGTAFLSEHELGDAYGHYRRADMIFEKVARLLEAMNLFSLEILHDTVVDELPAMTGASEEKGQTSDADTVRHGTEDMLAETRALLLTVDGFDEKVITQANSLLKDAMAHLMRGDIALILNDEAGAQELFARAHTQAERALEMVSNAARDLGVVNTAPSLEGQVPAGDALPNFTLTHRYEGGAHVWTGTMEVPTPCAVLETGALVAESYPEQITLTLNITEPADTVCTQIIDVRSFEIRAAASAEATVQSLKVNGTDRGWSVVEE